MGKMAKGYGERRMYRRDYRPPRGGYNRDRYNNNRFDRRNNRRDYNPRYRRDNFDRRPERYYGRRRYDDRPPRRYRRDSFRRQSFNKGGNNKPTNGDLKRERGTAFRRTGRRGAFKGGKRNENKVSLDDYWKKDTEVMKLKLNKELEDYMKNAPVPNNETKNETKEEAKA